MFIPFLHCWISSIEHRGWEGKSINNMHYLWLPGYTVWVPPYKHSDISDRRRCHYSEFFHYLKLKIFKQIESQELESGDSTLSSSLPTPGTPISSSHAPVVKRHVQLPKARGFYPFHDFARAAPSSWNVFPHLIKKNSSQIAFMKLHLVEEEVPIPSFVFLHVLPSLHHTLSSILHFFGALCPTLLCPLYTQHLQDLMQVQAIPRSPF